MTDSTCPVDRAQHPTTPANLRLLACALALAACTPAPAPIACVPSCAAGFSCASGVCVPDGNADLAASADMGAVCATMCSGDTPYCGPGGVCLRCLEDKNCPVGTICKNLGNSASCVPGCADDARCGGGAMKCCGGQCADTSKDARNCGGCGNACMAPNSTSSCANGACKTGMCAPGYGDCNNDPKDGCEANLHVDPKNCTACGMACSITNAVTRCSDGCYLSACAYGFDDCDGDAKNGCEIATISDPKNCGTCGKSCPAATRAQIGCNAGACYIAACNAGYSDCDGQYGNGCEVATGTDVNNCGTCGTKCAQGQVCINGGCTCPPCSFPNAKAGCFGNLCGIDSCNAGWANCDGNTQNGCEQNIDSDANNCGACGNKCPQGLVCVRQSCTCQQCNIPNAKSICVNNVCVLDQCLAGFANCDGNPQNGCEVDLNNDANNCSACGRACGQNMACSLGACTMCGNALIDNGSILCVPQGMTYALAGDLCYGSQVIINGTVTVKPWNGNTGGTLVLRSPSIQLGVNGKIVGDAAGNAGGAPAPAQGGLQGGGMGGGCGGGPGSSVGQGGSGGGYGGDGGTCKVPTQWTNPCDKCSQATIAHCYGAVGKAQGTTNSADYDMGGGGGAGGNSSGCANAGGRGGAGGAAIVLLAVSAQIDGAISSAGEAPPPDANNCGYHPGGGGGAGGAVVIRAATLTGKGKLSSLGGTGGASPGQNSDWGWAGGGGGGGRIKIFASTDSFSGTLDASPGAGGSSCNMTYCYAGLPGNAGTTFRSNSIPNNWTKINCGGQ